MTLASTEPGFVPPKHAGLRHLAEAAGYSLGGFKRLVREPAFRHEILFGGLLLGLLAVLDAPLAAFLVQGGLLLMLAAFEAVNTAIELIVDRVSPEWSAFAKNAKDLGSLSVACAILANLGPLAYVAASLLGYS